MFNIIEKEMQWRKEHGRPEGFEALKTNKPLVSVGAEGPLGGQALMADYYRASCLSKWLSSILLTSKRWHRWPRQCS